MKLEDLTGYNLVLAITAVACLCESDPIIVATSFIWMLVSAAAYFKTHKS